MGSGQGTVDSGQWSVVSGHIRGTVYVQGRDMLAIPEAITLAAVQFGRARTDLDHFLPELLANLYWRCLDRASTDLLLLLGGHGGRCSRSPRCPQPTANSQQPHAHLETAGARASRLPPSPADTSALCVLISSRRGSGSSLTSRLPSPDFAIAFRNQANQQPLLSPISASFPSIPLPLIPSSPRQRETFRRRRVASLEAP